MLEAEREDGADRADALRGDARRLKARRVRRARVALDEGHLQSAGGDEHGREGEEEQCKLRHAGGGEGRAPAAEESAGCGWARGRTLAHE